MTIFTHFFAETFFFLRVSVLYLTHHHNISFLQFCSSSFLFSLRIMMCIFLDVWNLKTKNWNLISGLFRFITTSLWFEPVISAYFHHRASWCDFLQKAPGSSVGGRAWDKLQQIKFEPIRRMVSSLWRKHTDFQASLCTTYCIFHCSFSKSLVFPL